MGTAELLQTSTIPFKTENEFNEAVAAGEVFTDTTSLLRWMHLIRYARASYGANNLAIASRAGLNFGAYITGSLLRD